MLRQWFEANATNTEVLPTRMKWGQFFPKWNLYVDDDDLLQFAKQAPEQSDVVEQDVVEQASKEESESEECTGGIHWCGPSAIRKDKYVFIFLLFFKKFPVPSP